MSPTVPSPVSPSCAQKHPISNAPTTNASHPILKITNFRVNRLTTVFHGRDRVCSQITTQPNAPVFQLGTILNLRMWLLIEVRAFPHPRSNIHPTGDEFISSRSHLYSLTYTYHIYIQWKSTSHLHLTTSRDLLQPLYRLIYSCTAS